MGKSIYNYEYLKDYCDVNNVTLNKDYSECFITRNSQIYGKCLNCNNDFNKVLRQLLRTGAYCNPCGKIKRNERYISTCLERFGVYCVLQNKDLKDKIRITCLQKYGFESALKSEEVKNKIKESNFEKYGVEYCLQSKEILEKMRKTCLERYGSENVLKLKEFKEKSKKSCLEKYGVENPSQNSVIAEKNLKNCYKKKEYYLPSGNILHIQGYEHYALNELLVKENIDENDIVTGPKNVPTIWYEDDEGKKHRHFVDIYIPSQKRCIEVKSTWTAEKKKDNIFLKLNAGKELGYNYEIWVYNNKGEKVNCYK